jgi:basic membrane lipoprotein Med (substrate-binding protein (PBP1-ABC) superfamily)
MITTINEFRKLFEDTAVQQQVQDTTLNSDKATQLTGYENDMGYYTANKNKLLALSQKPVDEKTESEANKVINGNIYLGLAWKMFKMQTSQKADQEKLGSQEISAEEKKTIQGNIQNNSQELNKIKKELDDKIKLDLGQIKKL